MTNQKQYTKKELKQIFINKFEEKEPNYELLDVAEHIWDLIFDHASEIMNELLNE